MKKVYLSGKIAGLSEEEYKQNFAQAAIDALAFFPDEQVTIVNPATLPAIHNSWADYLLRDLMLLKDCDAIVMMTGWMESKGALTEHAFAEGMGIDIYYLPNQSEFVMTEDQRNVLLSKLKGSALKDFGLQVARLFEFPKIKLKDGMLRYSNPPSNENKENQDEP